MNKERLYDFSAQVCRHRCKPLQNCRGLARPIILGRKVSLCHDMKRCGDKRTETKALLRRAMYADRA